MINDEQINNAAVRYTYITALSLTNNLRGKINSVLKLTRVCGSTSCTDLLDLSFRTREFRSTSSKRNEKW